MGSVVWSEAARLVFILFVLPKGRRPDDLRFLFTLYGASCRLLTSTTAGTNLPPQFTYPTTAPAYMEPAQSPNLSKPRTTPGRLLGCPILCPV